MIKDYKEGKASLYSKSAATDIEAEETSGRSSQMIMTLDDETQTNTIISSSVTHN